MPKSGRIPRRPPAALDCLDCAARFSFEWCVLPAEQLRMLSERKTPLTFLPSETLYHQGNECTGIYHIESGTVGLRKADEEGHSMLVHLHAAGDTLGYADLVGDGVYGVSATALTTTTVCYIERETLDRLQEENPKLGLQFLASLSGNLRAVEQSRLHHAALTVRARLSLLLLELKDRFGEADESGAIHMAPPLSRQDIADLLGVRAETVARTLHALREDNVLQVAGRSMTIPDLDNLLNEVESQA